MGQVRVERGGPLIVHSIDSDGGLRFSFAEAGNTLQILPRMSHLSQFLVLAGSLLQLRSSLLDSLLHGFK